jgi:hypothetical protein
MPSGENQGAAGYETDTAGIENFSQFFDPDSFA